MKICIAVLIVILAACSNCVLASGTLNFIHPGLYAVLDENNNLSFPGTSTPIIVFPSGSLPAAASFTLTGGADCARCVISDGTLNGYSLDPMASFVVTGPYTGYIKWADNTPAGYKTQLFVGRAQGLENIGIYGYKFIQWQTYRWQVVNDDPLNYSGMWVPEPSGFLADEFRGTVEAVYNPVPEPSSLLALLCGVGGLGGIMLRRRR